ncbi:MAG TPA: DciA family protein [Thermoanaerobaculia bacterium]|nr:DciA family protein [Thermoanaerobaculia bacterium]
MKKPDDPFTRLDQAGGRSLGRLLRGNGSPVYFESRWADVLGPYLSRKIAPAGFSGGALALKVADASCRKTVAGLLPQIEKKLRDAFPNVSSVRLL